VSRSLGSLDAYLGALHREIQWFSRHLRDVPAVAFYLGGGTPSMLSPDRLGALLDDIDRGFTITEGAEVTIECAPSNRRTQEEWRVYLAALVSRRSLPVTRVSFGVQSFDERTLRSMGRRGGLTAIMDLLQIVDELLPAYNIDVIVGYPGANSGLSIEDETSVTLESLARLLSGGFRIPSVSLYQLWDTDTIRVMHEPRSELPSIDSIIAAKWQLQNALFDMGYRPGTGTTLVRGAEFTHLWARHRHLSFRHVGMGSGVYSILPEDLVHRPRDIDGYVRAMERSGHAHELDTSLSLTIEEVVMRRIIVGLRSYEWTEGLPEHDGQLASGELSDLGQKISRLVDFGLVERQGSRLRLGRDAFLIANEISSYLHPVSHPRRPRT
jgi:oxygen-independent coproporphyrinogen-3 oxidase